MTSQLRFPDGFLWGAATAGHQVEGDSSGNDVWFLENLPGTFFAEPSGSAVEHYTRFRDDIALLAGLGLTTYRFSVEWARIEPVEGVFDADAIEHYRQVLLACHEHGLTPVVTYHHFASPLWLLAAGGWEDAATPARFARYCDHVTRELGDLIGVACTLNEPNLPFLLAHLGIAGEPPEARRHVPLWRAAGEALGIDPSRVAPFQFTASVPGFDVKLAAHRAGRDAIKAVRPDLPVGWTLANSDVQASSDADPRAVAAADALRESVNLRFLRASVGDDFVGVQTYGRTVVGPDGVLPAPAGAVTNQMDEEIYPQGLEATIREAWAVAGIPVIVTENGLATADDTQRLAYLQIAVAGVASCLADGIDVRGYIAWTAFDNYEWIFGYGPTFGLIAVDRTTQERTVKPSAFWLGNIAKTNGTTLA